MVRRTHHKKLGAPKTGVNTGLKLINKQKKEYRTDKFLKDVIVTTDADGSVDYIQPVKEPGEKYTGISDVAKPAGDDYGKAYPGSKPLSFFKGEQTIKNCHIVLDAKTGKVMCLVPMDGGFDISGYTPGGGALLGECGEGEGECGTDADCEEILPALAGHTRVCVDGCCRYRAN